MIFQFQPFRFTGLEMRSNMVPVLFSRAKVCLSTSLDQEHQLFCSTEITTGCFLSINFACMNSLKGMLLLTLLGISCLGTGVSWEQILADMKRSQQVFCQMHMHAEIQSEVIPKTGLPVGLFCLRVFWWFDATSQVAHFDPTNSTKAGPSRPHEIVTTENAYRLMCLNSKRPSKSRPARKSLTPHCCATLTRKKVAPKTWTWPAHTCPRTRSKTKPWDSIESRTCGILLLTRSKRTESATKWRE